MPPITNDWQQPLEVEFKKPYYKDLYKKVLEEYRSRQIFPNPDDIFNAFHLTPLKDVKVVILGQDPYHNDGQAHGCRQRLAWHNPTESDPGCLRSGI